MSDQLRSIYARWQNLEADKAAISEDLKELFAEAKGNGYDAKALRIAFRLKAAADGPDASAVAETASMVEMYVAALSENRLSRASAPARVEIIEESGLGGAGDTRPRASDELPGGSPKKPPATISDDDDIPEFMRRTA